MSDLVEKFPELETYHGLYDFEELELLIEHLTPAYVSAIGPDTSLSSSRTSPYLL